MCFPSRPTRARGLKPNFQGASAWEWGSRPTRARGLKQDMYDFSEFEITSRPTRARGLKLSVFSEEHIACLVAPHTGAWIETKNKSG